MGAVDSLRGHLLISGASLVDPNFRRTVVLIGHHDEDGAVGVVLNRETEVAVEVAVPTLASLVPPGDRLFVGGPVQPQAAVVLADLEHPECVFAEDAESLWSEVLRRKHYAPAFTQWRARVQ
jgi:putative transcriptional regulator